MSSPLLITKMKLNGIFSSDKRPLIKSFGDFSKIKKMVLPKSDIKPKIEQMNLAKNLNPVFEKVKKASKSERKSIGLFSLNMGQKEKVTEFKFNTQPLKDMNTSSTRTGRVPGSPLLPSKVMNKVKRNISN